MTAMNEKSDRAAKIRNLARKFKNQSEEAEAKNKELETKLEEQKQQHQKLEEEMTKLKTAPPSGSSKDDETQTEAAASSQQTPNEQASLNANIQQELKSQVGLLKSMLENKSKKLEETTKKQSELEEKYKRMHRVLINSRKNEQQLKNELQDSKKTADEQKESLKRSALEKKSNEKSVLDLQNKVEELQRQVQESSNFIRKPHRPEISGIRAAVKPMQPHQKVIPAYTRTARVIPGIRDDNNQSDNQAGSSSSSQVPSSSTPSTASTSLQASTISTALVYPMNASTSTQVVAPTRQQPGSPPSGQQEEQHSPEQAVVSSSDDHELQQQVQQPTSSQQMSLTSPNETAAVESNSTTAEVGFLFGQQNSTRTQGMKRSRAEEQQPEFQPQPASIFGNNTSVFGSLKQSSFTPVTKKTRYDADQSQLIQSNEAQSAMQSTSTEETVQIPAAEDQVATSSTNQQSNDVIVLSSDDEAIEDESNDVIQQNLQVDNVMVGEEAPQIEADVTPQAEMVAMRARRRPEPINPGNFPPQQSGNQQQLEEMGDSVVPFTPTIMVNPENSPHNPSIVTSQFRFGFQDNQVQVPRLIVQPSQQEENELIADSQIDQSNVLVSSQLDQSNVDISSQIDQSNVVISSSQMPSANIQSSSQDVSSSNMQSEELDPVGIIEGEITENEAIVDEPAEILQAAEDEPSTSAQTSQGQRRGNIQGIPLGKGRRGGRWRIKGTKFRNNQNSPNQQQ